MAPLCVFIQSFTKLVRKLLELSQEQRAYWRDKILDAVGQLGKVVTDVIPPLADLIGEQPDCAELSPVEADQRFRTTFLHFIQSFGSRDRSLVLFLDDLQWADFGSLSLLEAAVGLPFVQIIIAFRSNEVDSQHPLTATLNRIRKNRIAKNMMELELAPLTVMHVSEVMCDTLTACACCVQNISTEKTTRQRTSTEVDEMAFAAVVHAKTDGNPFFIFQYMNALKKDGLLNFDWNTLAWRWNLNEIRNSSVTENVVDLLVRCIKNLPETAQKLLVRCAFIGDRVPVRWLSKFCDAKPDAIATDIYEAISSGYLLFDQDNDIYIFAHDRIQQAAFLLCPEDEVVPLHAKIGMILFEEREQHSGEEDISLLFDTVRHLNIGPYYFILFVY
jgi:predicted ATPase